MYVQLEQRGDAVALFLSDQRMPGMSGVDFLEKAQKIYPDAKRALLTAYADTEAAIKAINTAKIHYYLTKPWDPPEEQLYPVLDDLLEAWNEGYRPPFEGLRVVGPRWSLQDHQVRDFLSRNQVPYVWLDPERDGEAFDLLARYKLNDHQLAGRSLSRRIVARSAHPAGTGGKSWTEYPCGERLLRPGGGRSRSGWTGGRRLRRIRRLAHAGRSSRKRPADRLDRARVSRIISASRPD